MCQSALPTRFISNARVHRARISATAQMIIPTVIFLCSTSSCRGSPSVEPQKAIPKPASASLSLHFLHSDSNLISAVLRSSGISVGSSPQHTLPNGQTAIQENRLCSQPRARGSLDRAAAFFTSSHVSMQNELKNRKDYGGHRVQIAVDRSPCRINRIRVIAF